MLMPTLLLLLAADPARPSAPAAARPLPRVSSLPFWVPGGIRAVLKDIPGALVVVEDTLPAYLPHEPPNLTTFRGHLRLRLREVFKGGPPMYQLPGMDGSEIWQGGNRLHTSVPICSANF